MSNENLIIYHCPIPGLSLYDDWLESRATQAILEKIDREVREAFPEPPSYLREGPLYLKSGPLPRHCPEGEMQWIKEEADLVREELECLADHAYLPDDVKSQVRSLLEFWDQSLPVAVMNEFAGPFLFYWQCLFVLCRVKTTLGDASQNVKRNAEVLGKFGSHIRSTIRTLLDTADAHPGWSRWSFLASVYNLPRFPRESVMDKAERLTGTTLSLDSPLIEKTLLFIEGLLEFFAASTPAALSPIQRRLSQRLLSEQSALISSSKVGDPTQRLPLDPLPPQIPLIISRVLTVKSQDALSLLMSALSATQEYEREVLNASGEHDLHKLHCDYVETWVDQFEKWIPNLGFRQSANDEG